MTTGHSAEPRGTRRLLDALRGQDDQAAAALAIQHHPADLAEILGDIDDATLRLRLFGLLSDELASRVFRVAGEAVRASLIDALADERLAAILDHLDTDDAADLIGDVPEERRRLLLQRADPETRRDVAELLSYAADTAGGIMKTEVASVRSGTAVRDVIGYLRSNAESFDDFTSVLVIDDRDRPIGYVPLRSLILADDTTPVDVILVEEHRCGNAPQPILEKPRFRGYREAVSFKVLSVNFAADRQFPPSERPTIPDHDMPTRDGVLHAMCRALFSAVLSLLD